MILHGEERHPDAAQAFDGVVVEVYMRQLRAAAHRIGVKRDAMILRCDFHLAGAQILDRVIGAMMPEIQFVGFSSEREAENLMPETNSEHRLLAQDAAHRLTGVGK